MATRKLPSFDELPKYHEYSGCAWEVWGKDDQLGTINLLTDEVVAEAAKEIKLGKMFSLNMPVNFPGKPLFGRQAPVNNQWSKNAIVNDDVLIINTQSGTQWDGMRHFGIFQAQGHNVFYNNTSMEALKVGQVSITDPDDIDKEKTWIGIHNWAQHGICGRGVLLDMIKFYTDNGAKPLPYDPWTTHAIPVQDLQACAKAEGVTFRTGDILILRVGFTQKWYAVTRVEREALHEKEETFAGIEQSEDMKRFLWDNHFAAIASDQPAIECWPTPVGTHMHSTLLGLWGMPIGEFFDLEKLAEGCNAANRYTFFFTSWPLNVLGGVASPPNAAAYL